MTYFCSFCFFSLTGKKGIKFQVQWKHSPEILWREDEQVAHGVQRVEQGRHRGQLPVRHALPVLLHQSRISSSSGPYNAVLRIRNYSDPPWRVLSDPESDPDLTVEVVSDPDLSAIFA